MKKGAEASQLHENNSEREIQELALLEIQTEFQKQLGDVLLGVEKHELGSTGKYSVEIYLTKDLTRVDTKAFVELSRSTTLGEYFSEIRKVFPKIVISGININSVNEDSGLNSNGEQALHHDGFNNGLLLYHPPLKFGETKRESPTFISVPEKYFPALYEEFSTHLDEFRSLELTSIKAEFESLRNSSNNEIYNLLKSRDYIGSSYDKNLSRLNLNYRDRLLMLYVSATFCDISVHAGKKDIQKLLENTREKLGNSVTAHEWDDSQLVMLDDEILVHGRGPKTKGSIRKSEIPIETEGLDTYIEKQKSI